MSNDVWTYREATVVATEIDVSGYDVEATDGSIGKVDEATYETGRSYLVVDTGPWIFGKKVMLPAGVVTGVDEQEHRVFVDRTKDEIKNAPEYDEASQGDDEYRGRLGSYYGGAAEKDREVPRGSDTGVI